MVEAELEPYPFASNHVIIVSYDNLVLNKIFLTLSALLRQAADKTLVHFSVRFEI